MCSRFCKKKSMLEVMQFQPNISNGIDDLSEVARDMLRHLCLTQLHNGRLMIEREHDEFGRDE